jgi:hypothetical protein
MTRRAAVLVAIALGAVVGGAPLPALAQQPGKVFRVGILSPAGRPDTKIFDAFRQGLADLGYIDGKNITIEYRLAAGDTSRLPAMAGELVRLSVDIIVTDTEKSAVITHEATRTIPIVGATLGPDPVAAGLAASLAHPGGNVTGFAGFGVELSGKRLQFLKRPSPQFHGSRHYGTLRTPCQSAGPPKRPPAPSACSSTPSKLPPRTKSPPVRGGGRERHRGTRRRAQRDVLERTGADRRPRRETPNAGHLP